MQHDEPIFYSFVRRAKARYFYFAVCIGFFTVASLILARLSVSSQQAHLDRSHSTSDSFSA